MSKKIIYITLLITSLTLIVYVSRETQILIPSLPVEIWSVLTDLNGNKDWNPVFVPFEGKLEEVNKGDKLTYLYTQPGNDPVETKMKVNKLEKPKQLNQNGGIWGILSVNHYWILQNVPDETLLTNREEWPD